MTARSPASSMTFSVNPNGGQNLILIASDGVRVSVNRAIATEVSYVLRDLLDGQDLVPDEERNHDGLAGAGGADGESFLHEDSNDSSSPVANAASAVPGPSTAANDLESLFENTTPAASPNTTTTNGTKKAAVPDLMDFFSVAPLAQTQTPTALVPTQPAPHPSSATVAAADDILASLWGPQPDAAKPRAAATPTNATAATPTATTHVPALASVSDSTLPAGPPAPPPPRVARPPPLPPAEVEVPFPYFTGDILERVCRHMSYRFRMSSFGTEDGCYRVYMVKTRTIPRPMMLPLVEYLDAKDRRFIADWDELTTVQMVKAATLLNYEELLQLASAKLATYLIDRDLEGVRTFLGTASDFDAVEEAELRKEQVLDFNR